MQICSRMGSRLVSLECLGTGLGLSQQKIRCCSLEVLLDLQLENVSICRIPISAGFRWLTCRVCLSKTRHLPRDILLDSFLIDRFSVQADLCLLGVRMTALFNTTVGLDVEIATVVFTQLPFLEMAFVGVLAIQPINVRGHSGNRIGLR